MERRLARGFIPNPSSRKNVLIHQKLIPDPSGALVSEVVDRKDLALERTHTLTAWLIKQGYRESLLEPCLYVHYAPGGSVDGLILIEVDDLAIGVPFWEVGKTRGQLCWQTNPTTRSICPG